MGRRKTVYLLVGLCLLCAVGVAAYLVTDGLRFDNVSRTSFSFNSDGGGFHNEADVYTEYGITDIDFSGEITVDGTAKILIVSDADGSVAYRKSYTDVTAHKLQFTVEGLEPYTSYTLYFSGEEARSGRLFLTTDQSLAQHPTPPPHPVRT